MIIIFITGCPIKNGNGHISRISGLSKNLSKNNITFLYIISSHYKSVKFIYKEYFNNYIIIKNYKNLSNHKNFFGDTLIIDDYQFPKNMTNLTSTKFNKLFYFKDNNIIDNKKYSGISPKLQFSRNNIILQNFFINPKIKIKKKIYHNKKILLSLGLGRTGNDKAILLHLLKRIDSNIVEKFIIDHTLSFNLKQLKFIEKFNNLKLVQIKQLNYMNNISNYAFSINAGGMTSLELIILKIPQITFKLSENQNRNISFLKKINNDCIKIIGKISFSNSNKFLKAFRYMSNNILKNNKNIFFTNNILLDNKAIISKIITNDN